MNEYRVGGRSVATAATANHVCSQFWNPSSTVPLWVTEYHCASTTTTASNLAVNRSTNKGATPTATVTPDIDNDVEKLLAPPSGAILELATFGTQPTLEAPPMEKWMLPATIGSAVIFVFAKPIKVGPGLGLCLYTPVAAILPASDVTVVWEE